MGRGGWIRAGLWGTVLALVLLRSMWLSLQPLVPLPGDPARLLVAGGPPQQLTLQGRLLADPSPSVDGSRCTALLQLPVGRTQLQLSPCPTPQPAAPAARPASVCDQVAPVAGPVVLPSHRGWRVMPAKPSLMHEGGDAARG